MLVKGVAWANWDCPEYVYQPAIIRESSSAFTARPLSPRPEVNQACINKGSIRTDCHVRCHSSSLRNVTLWPEIIKKTFPELYFGVILMGFAP